MSSDKRTKYVRIIKKLYNDSAKGSTRTKNKQKPESFIANIQKQLVVKPIVTVGMWKHLDNDIRVVILKKDLWKTNKDDEKMNKRIAITIRQFSEQDNPHVFCSVSAEGNSLIDNIIKYGYSTLKTKEKKRWNPRTVFTAQERQVTGKNK